ncbi:MAG: hypothetical protein J6R80_03080, partial [Kiritimatiellae bacterium]|nr:hypothetical protein [Kiritimatiellia bacterium]
MKNIISKFFLTLVGSLAILASSAQMLGQSQSSRFRDMLSNRRNLRQSGQQTPDAASQASPQPSVTAPADPGEVTMSSETSVMQMDGAPLELVLKIYGELVNKTIIVDPAVQSTLSNTIKFKAAPGQ